MTACLADQSVLITGGLGFIGSNLARRCLTLGAKVTILDNLDPYAAGNERNIHDFRGSVSLVRGDILRVEDLAACLPGADIVFHCAAQTSHVGSVKYPHKHIETNCQGTVNVLEAVRTHAPQATIVYVGTSTQIGPMQYEPIDEKHPEFPADMYSASKVAAEKYVLLYGQIYGMKTTSIRLANVFGPRSCIKDPGFGFINFFIGLALQGADIPIFGDGAQKRNFCYVEDAIEALIQASLNERACGEILFAVSDEHFSVADMAGKLVDCIGGKLRFVPWPKERAGIEVGCQVFTNRKIREVLGWRASFGMEEALAQTLDYYRPRLRYYLDDE